MTPAGAGPLVAARNIAAKAWRRAVAAPRHAVRLARRARRVAEQTASVRAEWQVEREIAAVAQGDRPIIAGPWLSEFGFEVLYWIPFLRWFEDRYRIDRGRVIAVSRGGVAEWYRDVAHRYVEIFDHFDPDSFARRNAERRGRDESGGQKQMTRGALDAELLGIARRVTGSADAGVCHPSLMYRLFHQFWFGNRALDLVWTHTRFAPIAVTAAGEVDLPNRYIAAKFYTGAALPDNGRCRAAVREIVRGIAERVPVVTLDTGLAIDDHDDYLLEGVPNVLSLRRYLAPRMNLALQTAVIAGSQGFVGTCGSLAWLAPMLDIDTIAVYADDRFLTSHLYFARQIYRQMGAAPFETLDLGAASELELLAPARDSEVARR
jgi:hypothetical protein